MVAASAYGDVTPTESTTTGGTEADLAEARKLVEEAGSPTEVINLVGSPEITDSLTQTLQALAEAGQKIGLNTKYKAVTLGQSYGLFDQMPWIPVVDVASTLCLNKDVTGPPASFVYWWYPWAAELGGASAG